MKRVHVAWAALLVSVASIAGCAASSSPLPITKPTAPHCHLPAGSKTARTTAERRRIARELETVVRRCGPELVGLIRDVAMVWHWRAVRSLAPGARRAVRSRRTRSVSRNTGTLRPVDLEPIDKVYALYLAHAAADSATRRADARYQRAELLWSLAELERDAGRKPDRWRRAATAFAAAADDELLDLERRKESAYAAVLAWTSSAAGAPTPAEATSVSAHEQQLIAAYHRYARLAGTPHDKELVMMELLEARLYWKHRLWDRAIPILQHVVTEHLSEEPGEHAVGLLLDSLNHTGRYDELTRLVESLVAKPAVMTRYPELAKTLRALHGLAQRKRAEALAQQGDYRGCGRAYETLHASNPATEGGDELLYNAGVCYQRAHATPAAVGAFRRLVHHYPKSALAARARRRLSGLGVVP